VVRGRTQFTWPAGLSHNQLQGLKGGCEGLVLGLLSLGELCFLMVLKQLSESSGLYHCSQKGQWE
jgi:hypothetical protein